jgi:hypothetical protein
MDRVGRLFGLTGDIANDTLTPYNREAMEDMGGEDNGVVDGSGYGRQGMDTNRGGRGHGHAGTKPGPTSKSKGLPNNHDCPTPATTAPRCLNGGFLWHRQHPQAAREHDVQPTHVPSTGNQGNAARQATFKDFTINYGQFLVYIAMIRDQKTITMIHTLGMFYSLKHVTNAYQGKVLMFIGDRRAMKEPTPICLPQAKAWQ